MILLVLPKMDYSLSNLLPPIIDSISIECSFILDYSHQSDYNKGNKSVD